MDLHVTEYFSIYSDQTPHGRFHGVIPLHSTPFLDWGEASQMAPNLCKGWYELARLSIEDRIEFTRDFWLSKLPYCPHLSEFLDKFFSSLDTIGVFLTQQKYGDPFEPQLVYSLANDSGFFRGLTPITESEIIQLQKDFLNYILPIDYLAFLQIHNGFSKLTDTGILPSIQLKKSYDLLQQTIEEGDLVVTKQGKSVNPDTLIPFYESFGMPYFQCFWADWYPDEEMGNVYYDAQLKTISPCRNKEDSVETLSFETFSEWLMFYLEKID